MFQRVGEKSTHKPDTAIFLERRKIASSARQYGVVSAGV
jgi:hypothetical protein